MRSFLSVILAGLLCSVSIQAQLFTLVTTNLKPLSQSSTAWGDFDNDGDLDLALNGEPGSTIPETHIYQNNNGTFVETASMLPGLSDGSVAWGDYDNDGDLDLLMTGRDNASVAKTVIINNDNGTFSESGIDLPGVMSGEAAWGDVDNDGDLDILLAGLHEGLTFYSLILVNDGNGQFSDLGEHFPGLQNASVAWTDYNNDGKLDVMIGGDSGGGMITRLYRQDAGTFTEVNPGGFMGLSNGDIRWADLDNDGDMDAVIAGVDLYLDGHIMLYRNDREDQFTAISDITNPIAYTSLDLGDYNNDGWLDIILTGKVVGCGTTAATMLFRNESFMNFFEESTLIPGFKQGEVTWGDFNNDGATDILFTGLDGFDAPKTNIYRNTAGSGIFAANTPPVMPQGLSVETSGSQVTVTWNRTTDAQTPSAGLSYNLYIGTASSTPDIVSPNANPASGIRHLASLGNSSLDTSITFTGLADGIYYWSVQAIDNGFLGSTFAPEHSFTINAVGINEVETVTLLTLSPNPATTYIDIVIRDAGSAMAGQGSGISETGCRIPDAGCRIDILDQTGKSVRTLPARGIVTRIDVSALASGLYIVRISQGDQIFLERFIKE